MTNLATAQQLAPSKLQLPVSAYFDVDLYQRELDLLFKRGPGYVGHELMVPEIGSFQTLTSENEGRILVRNQQGVELLSNVCRHRQALMLNGRGKADNIVCPLHRWTYDLNGELLGAPHFEDKPCLNLGKSPLQNWQGLLFEGPRDVRTDLAQLGVANDLQFEGYVLDHVEVHECNYNWKTFIEVYLEDYHVVPFHPGLGKFVSCEDLRWEFGDWHSVQTVGIHKNLEKPGSAVYQKWHEAVLRHHHGKPPRHGAIWLTYYPNVMVEWYPGVLCVSTLHPMGPNKTRNIVEVGHSLVAHYGKLAEEGRMTPDAAKTAAKEALRAMRYEGFHAPLALSPRRLDSAHRLRHHDVSKDSACSAEARGVGD
jgi:phenylpropionate dioxygenase-like ring-hydroxylating dioxygenase large terminal subunit